jgi:hypothetical protein
MTSGLDCCILLEPFRDNQLEKPAYFRAMAPLSLVPLLVRSTLALAACSLPLPSCGQGLAPVDSTHLVCFFPSQPFALVRHRPYADLPRPWQRRGVTGYAGVRVAISPNGAYRLEQVLATSLTTAGHTTKTTYLESPLAANVRPQDWPLYPRLVHYVQHEIAFRRDLHVPADSLTFVSFLVRFK